MIFAAAKRAFPRLRLGLAAALCAGHLSAGQPLVGPEFGMDSVLESPSPCTRSEPAIAVNSSGYLVAWSHGKSEATEPMIFAARISPAGQLLDPMGIRISAAGSEQAVCAAAANESCFFVVWSGLKPGSVADYDVLGVRIAPDGRVLDNNPIPVCTVAGMAQVSPAVASNGENFLVSWRDPRATGIYGTIVQTNGQVVHTNGFPISTAAYDQFTPAIGVLGTNYLVAWQDYRRSSATALYSGIYAARVSGDGKLLDAAGIPVCSRTNSSQFRPCAGVSGTNWIVAWEGYDPAGNDISAARVTSDGIVLETNGFLVCHALGAQEDPSLATLDHGTALVVWQDFRASATGSHRAGIYGARIEPTGTLPDGDGVPLSSGSGEEWFPALAARGSHFRLAWQDLRENTGTLCSDIYSVAGQAEPGLTLLGEARASWKINAQLAPAIAFSGDVFLAVWADNRGSTSNSWDIFGIRLSAGGVPLDAAAIPICTVTNKQIDPAVAGNGTNFFVVWTDFRNPFPRASQGDIYGTVVTRAGQVLQPNGSPICLFTNDQSAPCLAAIGSGDYLVAWQDARPSSFSTLRWDIYGARISGAGACRDPDGFPICNHWSSQTSPAVASIGNGALVVWADGRSGLSDIYGTPVDANGAVSQTNGVPICAWSGTQAAPSIASAGERCFVAWSDTRTSGAADIYGTFVTLNGTPQPTNEFPIRAAPNQQVAPTVACNGLDFLVAWQESRNPQGTEWDSLAVGIRPDGRFFDHQPFQINAGPENQTAPAAAGLVFGGKFVVLQQAPSPFVQRVRANVFNLEAIPRLEILPAYGLNLGLWGAPQERYLVEYSDDLVAWTGFLDFTSPTNHVRFADPGIFSNPHRFYRAVWLP